MGEYERTSTTVINAYVRPVVSSYLSELERKVYEMGIRVPLTVIAVQRWSDTRADGGRKARLLC